MGASIPAKTNSGPHGLARDSGCMTPSCVLAEMLARILAREMVEVLWCVLFKIKTMEQIMISHMNRWALSLGALVVENRASLVSMHQSARLSAGLTMPWHATTERTRMTSTPIGATTMAPVVFGLKTSLTIFLMRVCAMPIPHAMLTGLEAHHLLHSRMETTLIQLPQLTILDINYCNIVYPPFIEMSFVYITL